MPTRRALIVGAGVAGLTTALRLCRSDWEVVLVERASRSRGGGFPDALHGIGHGAAARLGLLPALSAFSQPHCDTVLVDSAGTPVAVSPRTSSSVPVLCRGDVVAVLREELGDGVVRRDADVLSLVDDDGGVAVGFTGGGEDWFDLVVGADGADSAVRSAVHGEPHQRQAHAVVSSRVAGTAADALFMELAGRSVRLHPLHDGRSAVRFTWRGDVFAAVSEIFGDLEWLPEQVLSQMDGEDADRRICSPAYPHRWALRQIVLVGDAAWCMGSNCDQGVSLAIGAAELLGDALDIFTDTGEALAWWEEQMRPVVRHVRRRHAASREQEVVGWNSPRTKSAS